MKKIEILEKQQKLFDEIEKLLMKKKEGGIYA